jgi:succinyl-diaminopimelate desuccinylase
LSQFDQINQKVEALRDEIVTVCSELVKRATPVPPGDTVEIVEYIVSYFKSKGIKTDIHFVDENKPNVVAHIKGESEKTIMWLGHLDVVPAGELKNWDNLPYQGVVWDNKVWGRGSSDMKGADACAMIAASVLNKMRPPHNVDFWFTCDEEIGGTAGAKWLAENQILSGEVCIVGDGGGCTPGMVNIGVGNKGGVTTQLISKGKTAHGSRPYLGDNALDKLLKVIPFVKKISHYRLELPPDLSPIIKSSVELLLRDEELKEDQIQAVKSIYDYPTGPSLNLLNGGVKSNVVPDYAEAVFDIRLTPGSSPIKVKERIEELVKEANVEGVSTEIRAGESAGYYEKTDVPELISLSKTVKKVTGEPPAYTIAPWGTDAISVKRNIKTKSCPEGIPCLIFGPMIESQLHQTNEYVPIRNLIIATKVYALYPFYFNK